MSSEEPSVLEVVLQQTARVLETYRVDAGLVQEHANGERRISEGGYGDRQIYELVQNGADELRNEPEGEIAVVLTGTHLYCANQGSAMTPEGADTILRMGVSRKRGGQIGRFGVGVKSVLSVSDVPEFFGREDDQSFGFDRDWAEQEIRRAQPDAAAMDMPVLRMARPLDRDRQAAADPVLKELLIWATTVVRLPLKPGMVKRLAKDIDAFPAEFSLFSPHVGTVTLEKRLSDQVARRRVVQQVDGSRRKLRKVLTVGEHEVEENENWRVFTRIYRPSSMALTNAGELHNRPEIDLAWAVPEDQRRVGGRGQFWAYFPTNYTTTLRGIINAPWKTSEDRQNLYASNAFNEELISEAAELVVSSFPLLATPAEPCAFLDFAPARGREEPQWAATDLVAKIWKLAGVHPTLPNQDGEFGTPEMVRVHPAEFRPEWLQLWRDYPGRPSNWLHHSVDKAKHRRDGVNLILGHARGIEAATAKEWLEALVSDGSPEASARAILIVADMKRLSHPLVDDALRAKIVLTESLGLVAPSNSVFRRSTADGLADNTIYVDERVYTEREPVIRALDSLGIHEAHHVGRFASVVERGFAGYNERDWTAFWDLARLAGLNGVRAAFESRDINIGREIKVKTLPGGFRHIRDCFLPGRIVPADGARDSMVTVDMNFHQDERPILAELGLQDVPAANVPPEGDGWFEEYRNVCWEQYVAQLPAKEARPTLAKMHFEGTRLPGHLHLFTVLSPEGRAAFLKAIPAGSAVPTWTMQAVNKGLASRRQVASPLRWLTRKYGYVHTSRGLRRVVDSVSPELGAHRDVLPIADVSTGVAAMLGLPYRLEDLRESTWAELVGEASASTDDAFPGKVYDLMFDVGVDFPEGAMTRCRVGDEWRIDVEDKDIAVTAVRSEYDSLIRERVPALLVPTDSLAKAMREGWGMLAPADAIQKDIRSAGESDPIVILEEFPYLKILRGAQLDGWSTVRCDELEEIIRTPNGRRTRSMPAAVVSGERRVLIRTPADDLTVLNAIDRVLKLALGSVTCQGVLDRRVAERNNERIREVRVAESIADKLLLLVGAEALKQRLPEGLLESDEAERNTPANERRIAELAHNAYLTDVLREYRKDIEAAFPQLAASFRGEAKALQVVNDLRFPGEYAGTRAEPVAPLEKVGGPRDFPRLHDYQERLAQKAVELLTKYDAPRAMLCLPTGAGKTRVAAEAVIRVIKERGLKGRPVLWIAQSDELCEQAVQSWAFVWSKVGPQEQLTINRLWASREAAPIKDGPQLVVATDAQLESCLDTPPYTWLRDPALVIIDEAHTSITPRYTRLLTSMGLTFRETSRPLIGLTATPFRGFNEAETRRLVERYGGNRLDDGLFETGDPYAELQDLEVLARVDHRQLKGMTLTLSEEDLQQVSTFEGAGLPSTVEAKLALNNARNEMLIQAIEALPEDSPVLLFAISVNHAKTLAAKLNGRGIRSAAIESGTPDANRRSLIEQFRSKQIRVLTNFGVLAQGFDAPATEVVIVARPTYSPNIYQQMIGRGLRGPKNGGNETCLILDVADNIVNYDRQLAFTQFEYLWSKK
ncbi:DEAD/DEAH box helicase [Nonomuraea endophytica]|uniref:Superfamily II DNA or RNA helicase n=1 Tax=Nonomuraea endophytica TaxID=714136 RepID=A0A7W7ZXI8_9ACTN|nr:DEAD/DEAH box helicase [Nonomuraea endophytica]MBB5075652.1 superfamily II DNA or RNA helicase [Nonomuraea endophytica]